ncbi:tetratricopeptide repeat protein [Lysobacter sp. CFH 32150]|uniref:tetratricopeptide repeat protein n=1 Tax=Lysobacter sp. CFH 32150 TaxID=2927128 RepID=UPI001FA7FADF|nr:tetratricopeptide repeat protein [Lysobacter sp. CFH 32150]MCI4567421.1 tetratricopeptide repeat protein [Lysobacter sp. CFH 32150]
MPLIAELKRRNVIRMAGLYLVGAWLIVQVAGTVLPMFGAPGWLPRSIVVLLALGALPALIFAWVFELTPEGLKRDADVKPEESIAPQTARRMERMILVLLALALAYFGFDKFVLAPRRAAVMVASAAASAAKPVPATVSKSIAVLPFTDLSPNRDQEYFSDGMAEEILNALAQVKDLKVAGRTSSFHFKGRNEDLREIGRTLGVAHILEGSVRKQGDKVRITAQLIQASDGTHMWSHAYDGDLSDVFQLQENIARAITDQLQVVLEGEQRARLVPVATSNPDAYSLYLQATAIFDRRDYPRFPDALADLHQAIKLDPKFARAYSRLAALTVVTSSYSDIDLSQAHADVLEHAREALALDPTLAEPYAAMGLSYGKLRGGYLKQREAFDRALQIDPDDVTSNFWYGLSLIMTGYHERGVALLDHALAVDPMMPNVVRWRGNMYRYAGDIERAEQYLKQARSAGLPLANRELAEIAFDRGDAATAIRIWPEGSRNLLRALPSGSTEVLAEGMFGDASARQRALAVLDTFLSKPHKQVPGQIPLTLIKLGQPSRALELLRTTQGTDNSDFFALMWSPAGKPLRALPEFPALLKTMGFIELWEKYGPPDLCKRVAPREYVCE